MDTPDATTGSLGYRDAGAADLQLPPETAQEPMPGMSMPGMPGMTGMTTSPDGDGATQQGAAP